MKPTKARDIVVPCTGGGHRVRLRLGRHFLSSARCPRCSSPVDRWRHRRTVAFARALARPATDSPFDVAVWAGAIGYSALALVVALAFRGLADRWWPATVLLYGPRWVLLLPLLPLFVVSAVRDRWLLVPLAAATWVVLVPVMGLQLGVGRWFSGSDPPREITVVTYNVAGGDALGVNPASLVSRWRADVLAMQECRNGRLVEMDAEVLGLHVSVDGPLCLLSRHPILETKTMEREVFRHIGGSAVVTAYRLDFGGREAWLTNLHLETPRAGLELIRAGRLLAGADSIRQLSFLRDVELRRAAAFAAELEGPRIVVGDFNTPVESRSYRTEWGGWTNAFSAAGRGFGGTRMNGWSR